MALGPPTLSVPVRHRPALLAAVCLADPVSPSSALSEWSSCRLQMSLARMWYWYRQASTPWRATPRLWAATTSPPNVSRACTLHRGMPGAGTVMGSCASRASFLVTTEGNAPFYVSPKAGQCWQPQEQRAGSRPSGPGGLGRPSWRPCPAQLGAPFTPRGHSQSCRELMLLFCSFVP